MLSNYRQPSKSGALVNVFSAGSSAIAGGGTFLLPKTRSFGDLLMTIGPPLRVSIRQVGSIGP
ncbi:hypothetical protein HanLR1_Chr10g0351061 [Helianthus annuus]|nr:hypothetical protein HanLR1_Chr10g0351061 [Helianthus annuus]